MRAVMTFFAGSIAAAAALLVGCGATTSDAPAGADSGTSGDATAPIADSSFSDSPVTGSEDSAVISDGACVFSDADLNTATPVDAALDDAGASVGTCLACAQTSCQSDVTACNGDACCESTFACAFDCLSGVGASLLYCYTEVCGGTLSGSNIDAVETKLGQCAIKSCATACALCTYDSNLCPADAGKPVSDAGSDAADASDAAED